MKITIDTKEDSKEEIAKAIDLLRSLSGSEVKTNFAPMDMFGAVNSQSTPVNPGDDSTETVSNPFANTEPEAKKEEEKPQGLIFLD